MTSRAQIRRDCHRFRNRWTCGCGSVGEARPPCSRARAAFPARRPHADFRPPRIHVRDWRALHRGRWRGAGVREPVRSHAALAHRRPIALCVARVALRHRAAARVRIPDRGAASGIHHAVEDHVPRRGPSHRQVLRGLRRGEKGEHGAVRSQSTSSASRGARALVQRATRASCAWHHDCRSGARYRATDAWQRCSLRVGATTAWYRRSHHSRSMPWSRPATSPAPTTPSVARRGSPRPWEQTVTGAGGELRTRAAVAEIRVAARPSDRRAPGKR